MEGVHVSDFSTASPRVGRAPSTSIAELSHVGLQLFLEHGFDATTVDDIAAAAGISRRTFFRYFASKNDLPWGEFDDLIERMRAYLAEVPADTSLFDALRGAVLEFNRFPDHEVPYHRQRMDMLLNVPSLVAHSTLRYAAWREAVAEFVGARLEVPADSMRPQVVAWTLLAVSLSAYEQWLRIPDSDLQELIVQAFRQLQATLAT